VTRAITTALTRGASNTSHGTSLIKPFVSFVHFVG
jgi:hypothetical protein